MRKLLKIIIILIPVVFFASCALYFVYDEIDRRATFSNRENYNTYTATVVEIKPYRSYNDTLIFLTLSNVMPKLSDVFFEITGDNALIVKERKIYEKIKPGDEIQFMTAQWYREHNKYPIVQISVNGEELLSFEEGFKNYVESPYPMH